VSKSPSAFGACYCDVLGGYDRTKTLSFTVRLPEPN